MMKTILADCNSYFTKEGFVKFQQHILRERKGFSQDLRTHFYGKDTPRDKILDSWGEIIENSNEVSPEMLEFEHKLREKVGPISLLKPLSERISDLESYYSPPQGEEINGLAIQLTAKVLSKSPTLRMKDQKNVLCDMKKSTSAGAPTMGKRNKVINKIFPCTIKDGVVSLPIGKFNACSILGHRTQEGGPSDDDVKNRIIFMFMFALNLLEHQVYQPCIAHVQANRTIPAYVSNDYVDEVVTNLFDSKGRTDLIVCTDFDKFDHRFGSCMQQASREILYNMFQPGSINEWLKEVYPCKYTIPTAYEFEGDKVILGCGDHGMSSGSGGTNFDETLAHMAIQRESAMLHNQDLNPHSMCLGDDGILSYPKITIDKVVKNYSAHGLIMNTSKQEASTNTAVFLRRFYQNTYRIDGICRGVYSTYRAIGRLMAYERSIPWTKELVALRQLSIIENTKWHPLKEQFARWCMKGDRYQLGLQIPGFFDNLSKIVKESMQYMPDIIGYNKSNQSDYSNVSQSIHSWWIVKYLKSMGS